MKRRLDGIYYCEHKTIGGDMVYDTCDECGSYRLRVMRKWVNRTDLRTFCGATSG